MISEVPPGANGTTKRIGLEGHACASAASGKARTSSSAARIDCVMSFSPVVCSSIDDFDVLLVQPLRERIEQRCRDLHPAALRQADVALALRVAVADGDVAFAAAVL